MNVILLGAPGAGKGTAAPLLCQKLDLRHISTGNIFRDEIARKTEFGLKVQKLISEGNLVPDSMVMDIVTATLRTIRQGFLFDGFPRTVAQATELDAFLKSEGRKIDFAILIDANEDVVVRRIAGRRTCGKCGQIYNVLTGTPPKAENVCDKCGGALRHREDDTETAVRHRMVVYREQTEPLIEYYKTRTNLIAVDGTKTPAEVNGSIFEKIGVVAR
ncbi:MAG: adenylate kinase [Elusimicrobiaceae bacterium]|nr:adenylate kinase [Elusimicrobiaceae bacterium]